MLWLAENKIFFSYFGFSFEFFSNCTDLTMQSKPGIFLQMIDLDLII